MNQQISASTVSSDAISQEQLTVIKQRFMQVNRARLARAMVTLEPHQQIFLELLPMFFHINEPELPGYISQQTPAGLAEYQPSTSEVQKAQRLAGGINYHEPDAAKAAILGLFLMGSSGTIAQSEKSDLDIWVCHAALEEDEQRLLRGKCDRLSSWANSIGLDAHFFLMEDEKFRSGERESLSAEDCGSTQHILLLDEFYRTGLLIAGKLPLWWLVPPEQEQNYEDYIGLLKQQQLLDEHAFLDFGSVGIIPAGEFIGAGVWQLYKAIDSPYKSVLKILLTEVYAAEYPRVEPLSTQFKRSVYNDELDIDELDPYVVVYRKLARHLLSRQEHKRLDLIRRCFYFKVGIAVSRSDQQHSKSWQRRLMEKLVREWGWSVDKLFNLDDRSQWKVGRVVEEQKQLVSELTNSYRFLLDFARQTRASTMINSNEMAILGRKLYAAFERKAGKVEWINPGISNNMVEQQLGFYQTQPYGKDNSAPTKPCWAVSTRHITAETLNSDRASVKQHDELVALLAWCHFNGLLGDNTRLALVEQHHGVITSELQGMLRSMKQLLPTARQAEEQYRQFGQAMRPVLLQLFINVGADPLADSDNLTNAPSINPVANIEQVLVNSWGELNCRRFAGESALLNCLRMYLQVIPVNAQLSAPKLDVRCFCATRPDEIALRLEEIFQDTASCLVSDNGHTNQRYVLEIEANFYIFQFVDGKLEINRAANQQQLLHSLGALQERHSAIVLDRYCLVDSVLASILDHSKADQVQVFFQRHTKSSEKTADVYVIDERGSLYSFSTPFHSEQSLLSPLDQFIQSTLIRRNSEQLFISNTDPDYEADVFDLNKFEVDYYEVVIEDDQSQLVSRDIGRELKQPQFFNVQAIGDKGFSDRPLFNIYCNQQEFTELEHGAQLFHKVAEYILSHRQSDERYPCYITDLDLSHFEDYSQQQTAYFLQQKSDLEQALNQALQEI